MKRDDLNRLAVFVDRAKNTQFAFNLLATQGHFDEADGVLNALHKEAIRMAMLLELAGADRPDGVPAAPVVPLRLLDTPANRHLAECLRETLAAARMVDLERGDPVDGGPADIYDMLLREVEMEIHGPQERE